MNVLLVHIRKSSLIKMLSNGKNQARSAVLCCWLMLREALAQWATSSYTAVPKSDSNGTVTTAQTWRWGSAVLPNWGLTPMRLSVNIRENESTDSLGMMKIVRLTRTSALIALIRCWWWSRDLRDFLPLVRSSADDALALTLQKHTNDAHPRNIVASLCV